MANARIHRDHCDPDCELTVYQRIGLTGEVVITPKVEFGPVTVTCLDAEIVRGTHDDGRRWSQHHCEEDGTCKILIYQELCVEVPVRFGAETECELTGVFCGPASTDPADCLFDDSDSSGDSWTSSSESPE